MVRQTLLPTMLLLAVMTASAQQNEQPDIIRKGLLRAQGTITPAVMLNGGALNIYLLGDMDFYLSRRVSVRADGYYFLDTQGGGGLLHNHGVFFGLNYHFPVKGGRFDPYLGLQPGASYVQARYTGGLLDHDVLMPTRSRATLVPNISASAGFNYYIWKYLHFQMMVRYVHGNHATPWGSHPLDELRFSIGLGWNVNTIKAGKGHRR
jgi:hypothetical protein